MAVQTRPPKYAMAAAWRDSAQFLDVHVNKFSGPFTNVSQRLARDTVEIA
jgi:hypothetical protein